MKCSFCGEKSVSSLLWIVNGSLVKKSFCEGHKKNNPVKEKNFHISEEPEREEQMEPSVSLEKEESRKPSNSFERILNDIFKENEDGTPLDETEEEHDVFSEPKTYNQKPEEKSVESLTKEMLKAADEEDFQKAADLRDEINAIKKNADDNPDLCGV